MKFVDKAYLVPCADSIDTDFFAMWVAFLMPKHHLTKTDQRVLAAILRSRYELSKSISDEKLLEEVCLNKVHKNIIRKSLNMSSSQFNGVMGKLRNLKIVIYNPVTGLYRIDPNYVASLNENGEFHFMIVFKDAKQENNNSSREGV